MVLFRHGSRCLPPCHIGLGFFNFPRHQRLDGREFRLGQIQFGLPLAHGRLEIGFLQFRNNLTGAHGITDIGPQLLHLAGDSGTDPHLCADLRFDRAGGQDRRGEVSPHHLRCKCGRINDASLVAGPPPYGNPGAHKGKRKQEKEQSLLALAFPHLDISQRTRNGRFAQALSARGSHGTIAFNRRRRSSASCLFSEIETVCVHWLSCSVNISQRPASLNHLCEVAVQCFPHGPGRGPTLGRHDRNRIDCEACQRAVAVVRP